MLVFLQEYTHLFAYQEYHVVDEYVEDTRSETPSSFKTDTPTPASAMSGRIKTLSLRASDQKLGFSYIQRPSDNLLFDTRLGTSMTESSPDPPSAAMDLAGKSHGLFSPSPQTTHSKSIPLQVHDA